MFEIRRIAADDATTLRGLRLAALQDEPSAFGSTFTEEVEFSAARWDEMARERAAGDPGTNFFAFDADGVPVALVGVFRSAYGSSTVEITSMWVAPPARGKGIGAQLVRAAIEWAEVSGHSAIELWVTHGNDVAQGLYRRLGFVETDDIQPLPSDPCCNEVRMIWRGWPEARSDRPTRE